MNYMKYGNIIPERAISQSKRNSWSTHQENDRSELPLLHAVVMDIIGVNLAAVSGTIDEEDLPARRALKDSRIRNTCID